MIKKTNNLQNENYNILHQRKNKTKTKVFEKRLNKMRKHKLA